jgi:hypothetical protein
MVHCDRLTMMFSTTRRSTRASILHLHRIRVPTAYILHLHRI